MHIPFGRLDDLRQRPDAERMAYTIPQGTFGDYRVKTYASRKALIAFCKPGSRHHALIKTPQSADQLEHGAAHAMKITVDFTKFLAAFDRVGRTNQFTHNGLAVLYDYLIEKERETGHEHELDPIELCCTFTESTCQDVADDYGLDDPDDATAFLEDQTTVVGSTVDTVIFVNF